MAVGRVISFSVRYRFLIVALAGLLVGIGIYSVIHLPIDAVPDATTIQVQINTEAPGLGPVEVERLITYPIETAMMGIKDVDEVRSLSLSALSQVTVVFKDRADIYWARQQVMERLQTARERIPLGLGTPTMAPISTGLGEIYQYVVKGEGRDLYELRTIQDWLIRFQLLNVPGVVEVNSHGGLVKQYQVLVDPNKLVGYRIPLRQVFESLAANNLNAGGAYIEHVSEKYLVRGIGLVQTMEDIENIIVDVDPEGTPIYVKNLAEVAIGPEVRYGAATQDGKGEVVTGVTMMLKGENSRTVTNRVKEKVKEIIPTLPAGIGIEPFHDRIELVNHTIRTVIENLSIGILLVIGVVMLILGNWVGALIVSLIIPLTALFSFACMYETGIPASLMSLGALDFGIVVDGSVVMVENIIRRLHHREPHRGVFETTVEAGREVGRPVIFAIIIIIIVYLPVFSLQGIEGKMFRPMAFTVCYAMIGSLILSLTFAPALCGFLFHRGLARRERGNVFHQFLIKLYRPALQRAVRHNYLPISIAGGMFAGSVILVLFMGSEFIPRLEEGSIALHAIRLPSVSLTESINATTKIETVLREFPEVETVVSKTGRAEIATDPMGPEVSDVFVTLRPRKYWKSARTKEGLIEKMKERLEAIPGMTYAFSQPIEMRVNELIAGTRSDVAIKVFGEDFDVLKEKADSIEHIIADIRGAEDVRVEQVSGLPVLQIVIDREAIARHGINVADVQEIVETAIGGRAATQVLEGEMRFDMVARFPEEARQDIEGIRNILVSAPGKRLVPMGQLADIQLVEGQVQISRENSQRRMVVECNVRGRDVGSFVAEARREIAKRVSLPAGYYIDWGGQFENMQRARLRLSIVVPIALFLIFILLFTTFGSLKNALLIYINVPIAATGGIFALAIRGMPLSISAGVGFIALFGLSVLFGIVMVSRINDLLAAGLPMKEAVLRGAEERLRPVLITSFCDIFGFLPMAVSWGVGAEVQRPLATVVIGGLIFSTFLTLFVLPSLYQWFAKKPEVTGPPPSEGKPPWYVPVSGKR
ncbi:MAG: CusA/CzcA family heavy metal efflux RND transporter [Candidatus Brocadiaceae bacterium]|nr:CusA/CzcA family heavy metal efflux RND transporter [Candidatus Brocadiaceae bacterium]